MLETETPEWASKKSELTKSIHTLNTIGAQLHTVESQLNNTDFYSPARATLKELNSVIEQYNSLNDEFQNLLDHGNNDLDELANLVEIERVEVIMEACNQISLKIEAGIARKQALLKKEEDARIEAERIEHERIKAVKAKEEALLKKKKDARIEAERIEHERIKAVKAKEKAQLKKKDDARIKAERIEREQIKAVKAKEKALLKKQDDARIEAERLERERIYDYEERTKTTLLLKILIVSLVIIFTVILFYCDSIQVPISLLLIISLIAPICQYFTKAKTFDNNRKSLLCGDFLFFNSAAGLGIGIIQIIIGIIITALSWISNKSIGEYSVSLIRLDYLVPTNWTSIGLFVLVAPIALLTASAIGLLIINEIAKSKWNKIK